ncbi:MAG: FAD synthase [Euryarchaeota archaeon]|nr:FAD synthase [Euryarchaeota archaeon]
MAVVLAGGVFDLLHPGHVYFLSRARALGDALAVVVARDARVRERKRLPVVPEQQRVEMLRALKPVDVALVGGEDMREVIELVRPEVIALGPDQRHAEEEIQEMCRALGLECRVVRLDKYTACPLPSTRSIIERVLELFGGR